MGRSKKYTPGGLYKAVERYFAGITREVAMTELKPTGEKDQYGHQVLEPMAVVNRLGEQVTVTEYVIPPTIGGLCEHLGIHRSTWSEWCDAERYPEFSDTTTRVRGRIHAYLEQESLTRAGKDLKGVLFNLENNFGYSEKVEVNSSSIEEYLKHLEDDGQGQVF